MTPPKRDIAPAEEHVPATGLTEEELAQIAADADKGLSKEAADNLVPLVYILQKMSPQVEPSDNRYIQDARAGDIWLRNAPRPIVRGSEGIIFLPCAFFIDWVEWVPREKGGGFVARLGIDPADPDKCPVPDAVRHVDEKNRRIKYTRPNGNEVIQTRNHVGYVTNGGVAPLPFVIPMTSTGHTISRQWMTKMNSHKTVQGHPLPRGASAPSWAYLYRLRTRQRSNPMGVWFTWDVSDERETMPDWELYKMGKALNASFESGEKTAESPETGVQDDASSNGE